MVSQVQVHANPKEAWELICTLESEVSEQAATIATLRTDLAAVRALLERAGEGLEIIAGERQCIDNLMSNADIARALRDEIAAALKEGGAHDAT